MSCTSISTRYAEGCGITIERYPSPCPSRQARLGELATQSVRIRKRMRMGRGDAFSTAAAGLPLPHPHSLANADAISCKLAKASLPRGLG